jgi:hypothetical protein
MSSFGKMMELCENVPYSDLAINIVVRKADLATGPRVLRDRRFEATLR